MDKRQRELLKDKITEISQGFTNLIDKIDTMPDEDFKNIEREVDEFRFKYAKVLNLSPDGR